MHSVTFAAQLSDMVKQMHMYQENILLVMYQ